MKSSKPASGEEHGEYSRAFDPEPRKEGCE